mgnify:CR=1 FL=1
MFLNNKLYDAFKWVAQFLLPGLATLYFALSNVWDLPYTEQIVGTIVAFDVFLGVILGISNIQYQSAERMETRFESDSSWFNAKADVSSNVLSMDPKLYDILKWSTLIFLPACGTLYFALSGIWGFPYGEQVVGTIAAVTTFMGLMLGISTYQYNKETEIIKS